MNYETISFKIKYPGLSKTLSYLLDQAYLSIDYCRYKFGTNNDIQDIWNIGKSNLIYHHDKKNIEQIQNVGTLFENNIHGTPGAGDCDCFTVFTIAMLLANNHKINDIYIILQGKQKDAPSHILTAYNNKLLDFTEPHFNTVRNYNYFQILSIQK
jgi:hypothetical protein